jgi:hypothetical protein
LGEQGPIRIFDERKRGAAKHILLCSKEHIKNIHTLEFRHLGI